jgi:AraC-like DNA-binding protein
MYEPSICVIGAGRKEVRLGNQVWTYTPDRYLLVPMSVPITTRMFPASVMHPHLALHIRLDPTLLAGVLADVDTADLPRTTFGRGVAIGTLDAPLLDTTVRLVRLLDRPRAIPVLAPLVLRELYYLLLTGPHGGILRDIVLGSGKVHRIAAVIERLRREYDQPVRIAALAHAAAMSPSSLHAHFKALTTMSPLQYVKVLRLQAARNLIVTEQTDVSSAGARVGYHSPSQFSREYHRFFGASPRAHVAALHTASALPHPSPAIHDGGS